MIGDWRCVEFEGKARRIRDILITSEKSQHGCPMSGCGGRIAWLFSSTRRGTGAYCGERTAQSGPTWLFEKPVCSGESCTAAAAVSTKRADPIKCTRITIWHNKEEYRRRRCRCRCIFAAFVPQQQQQHRVAAVFSLFPHLVGVSFE